MPLHFNLVVLKDGELLLFGCVGGGNGRFLLGRVDFHQYLAGVHPVAGMDVDPDQVAVDLRIDRRRAPGLDSRDILIILRDRSGRDGLCLHRHRLRRCLRRTCLAQAVNASTAKGMHCLIQTGSLLKTKSSDAKRSVQKNAIALWTFNDAFSLHEGQENLTLTVTFG